jgi:hypothetical protein
MRIRNNFKPYGIDLDAGLVSVSSQFGRDGRPNLY